LPRPGKDTLEDGIVGQLNMIKHRDGCLNTKSYNASQALLDLRLKPHYSVERQSKRITSAAP
jgi:hypothetical protein